METTSRLSGRYVLEKGLNRKGAATTWLAHPRKSATPKLIIKELQLGKLEAWQSSERVIQQVGQLASLDHPNLPDVVDLIREPGAHSDQSESLYLVQEYIKGPDLGALLQAGKRFTQAEVLAIAKIVAKILVYLQGLPTPIIHRDIKPGNLLIRLSDRKVYLVDFAAVKGATAEGYNTIGTPGYMPIEQLADRAVPASDQYALGMTLIQLLSQQEPWKLPQVNRRPDFRPYVNVSDLFARIIDKMIHPIPEARFADAATLLRVLEAFETTEKSPKPESVSETSPVAESGVEPAVEPIAEPEIQSAPTAPAETSAQESEAAFAVSDQPLSESSAESIYEPVEPEPEEQSSIDSELPTEPTEESADVNPERESESEIKSASETVEETVQTGEPEAELPIESKVLIQAESEADVQLESESEAVSESGLDNEPLIESEKLAQVELEDSSKQLELQADMDSRPVDVEPDPVADSVPDPVPNTELESESEIQLGAEEPVAQAEILEQNPELEQLESESPEIPEASDSQAGLELPTTSDLSPESESGLDTEDSELESQPDVSGLTQAEFITEPESQPESETEPEDLVVEEPVLESVLDSDPVLVEAETQSEPEQLEAESTAERETKASSEHSDVEITQQIESVDLAEVAEIEPEPDTEIAQTASPASESDLKSESETAPLPSLIEPTDTTVSDAFGIPKPLVPPVFKADSQQTKERKSTRKERQARMNAAQINEPLKQVKAKPLEQRKPRSFKLALAAGCSLILIGWLGLREQRTPISVPKPAPTAAVLPLMSAGEYLNQAYAFYRNRQYPLAIQYFTAALKPDGESENQIDLADLYFSRAYSYGQLGEHLLAVKDYEQALKLDPKIHADTAEHNLGYNYYFLTNYPAAIQHFKAQLKLQPDHLSSLNYLGLIYQAQEKPEEALAAFNQALALDSRYPFPYNNRGRLHFEQGRREQAMIDFEQAIALAPDYALPHYNKAELYWSQQNYLLCVHEATEAIRLQQPYASAYNIRGLCRQGLGEVEQAISDFQKAATQNKAYATAWLNLGLVYDDAKKLPEAQQAYEQAININPQYDKALNNLGYVYERIGQPQEALSYYSRAIEVKPEALYYNNRAGIYKQLHNCPQALEDWSMACARGLSAACKPVCQTKPTVSSRPVPPRSRRR